ncbi:hypothetical protein HDU98_001669 [Podochytrium sp. JEL0797]|nr:hypothetical protein HDU98_001669 [Podochytrium sp. JEL0797]
MIEASFLTHIKKGIADGSYPPPTPDQQSCLSSFDTQHAITFPLNFMFWSGVGYFAMDPMNRRGVPIHIRLFSAVAVAAGGFGTTYLLTRRYHRACLQCILDGKDKTSEFYAETRRIMELYHPDHKEYFNQEKYKLLRPGVMEQVLAESALSKTSPPKNKD